jgi:hypothetical protein
MNWTLGLNFYSSNVILFNPSDLDNEPTTKQLIESDKYHIYLICKRKKVFFESCILDGTDFCKTTLYYLNDKHEKVYLRYRHPSNLIINSYENGFYNIDFNGQKNLMIRDFMLINNYNFLEKDTIGTTVTDPLPSDLEVMYIGQSFGRTTLRKIDYRLENHDKMQKIALQILNSGSNEEVLIVGLKVEVSDLGTSFVSVGSDTKKVTVESLLELQKKASQRIPEGQELTVFEASLISHFRPKLNTEYKDSFPEKGTISYNEIYNLSFDYSSMAIDTRPVFVRIYSDFIKERKYIHSNHFPLTSESDKATLFEYLYEINNK